jgi:hypothetical protein
MLTVAIYIKDIYTSEYNRVDLFDDEKISVLSSIQNINDISKIYTDFSQTFTVPASTQNNKIFRHWYDNSNDSPFSTLVKSDAYIEIDTILFRSGKIQLESANLENGMAKNYSITFIGVLGNLKDTFAGKFLKDLTDTTYNFNYSADIVKQKVTTLTPTSPATPDIAFPLVSSTRYWNYGNTQDSANDISLTGSPIRFIELFPAIKISAVFNMIETQFGINFNGSFLTNGKFTNAYLLLKNAETFSPIKQKLKINWTTEQATNETGFDIDLASDRLLINAIPNTIVQGGGTYTLTSRTATTSIVPTTSGVEMLLSIYKNGVFFNSFARTSVANTQAFFAGINIFNANASSDYYEFYVETSVPLTFYGAFSARADYQVLPSGPVIFKNYTASSFGSSQTMPPYILPIAPYMPEIKIEDFFSGVLKMFNLTCFSSDGINYTVEQLEDYYLAGSDVDLTQYIIQDKKVLNRVKTYKRINFEYEKSQAIINVAFNSINGVEYGSLLYNTNNDGAEYNIKLPFEDLGFQNLKELLQVGYALKTDLQKYIPKPIILYEYSPNTLITLSTDADFYFNTNVTGGTSTLHNTYRAFGQEYFDGTDTFSLNFNQQQSTLTNVVITNGLYDEYYKNYFINIFNFKARLIKVSAILPTSILTSLKLNDNVIIRDEKYLINTMNIDVTTGVVQFELLTDQRQ